jgi:hypothetical protein
MQRTKTETWLLYGLMILTLALATAFVIATVFRGYAFPAVYVSLILAAFVAILAYTALGGAGGDVFQLGPAKLTGAIAGLIAVFWLVNGPMNENMKDARAIETRRSRSTMRKGISLPSSRSAAMPKSAPPISRPGLPISSRRAFRHCSSGSKPVPPTMRSAGAFCS